MVDPLLAEIFSDLTEKELMQISPYLIEKQYKAGEVILHQGGTGGDLYLIRSGRVVVKVMLPGDMPKVAAYLEPGAFFGEMAFLSDGLIAATLVADEAVSCAVLMKTALAALRIFSPKTAFKFERAIARRASQRISAYLKDMRDLLKSIALIYPPKPGHGHYLPRDNATVKTLKLEQLSKPLLSKIAIFLEFKDDELDLILPFFQLKHYEKGYRLTQCATTEPKSIHVVTSGAVMHFVRDSDVLLRSISVIGTGELFFTDFFEQQFLSIIESVTCEACGILSLPFDAYVKIEKQFPPLFYKLSRALHRHVVSSLYILNREFVRINTEYRDLLK